MSYLLKAIFIVGGALTATAVVVMMLTVGVLEEIFKVKLSDKSKQTIMRICTIIALAWLIVGLYAIYSLVYSFLATGGS
jgi:hypothetical protein